MNRLKNLIILFILISFLSIIAKMPVACVFKTVTGIFCPACGMTRAFLSILHFDFLGACYLNIISIPFMCFLLLSIVMLCKDFIQNRFYYIPTLLHFFEHHSTFIIIILLISFVFNNLKH